MYTSFLYNFFRLEANAGQLTNFEALNFLKSKGASKDPTRVLADVAPSEYKVLITIWHILTFNVNDKIWIFAEIDETWIAVWIISLVFCLLLFLFHVGLWLFG